MSDLNRRIIPILVSNFMPLSVFIRFYPCKNKDSWGLDLFPIENIAWQFELVYDVVQSIRQNRCLLAVSFDRIDSLSLWIK